MLLRTDKGEDNRVPIPAAARKALGNHTWTPPQADGSGGYQPAEYAHKDFPRLLYKPRVLAANRTREILLRLVGIKDAKKRQAAYLQALEELAATGADIREFPLTVPEPDVLKSFLTIIGAKLAAFDQEQWLAQNASKTVADYKVWLKSSEHVQVENAAEMSKLLSEGWFLSPDCRPAKEKAA